ncbi:MAG: hypothetical protein IJI41_08405 [Anaerolineaceae bacterium]|nr:hypothetical protein [Anaerolineaceae bacterium]
MGKASTILKAFIKVTAFILIFAALLYLVMCVLLFKQEDGTLPMRNFYDLPEDTVDVLFLGSSHIGMNISTDMLWNKYGIAGYKCWGSTQPIWNTYYYLKECLKYQTPKVVVVDVHGATFSYDYADYVLQIKNTMGMRFSQNKIDAVINSAPENQWGNLLLELPTFHTRYNELTEADFQYFPWNKHNDITVLVNQAQDLVFPFEIIDKDQTTETEPMAEKEEKYLRAIIELCQEKNVPLELIAAPYQLSEFEQKRFRGVRDVISEYEGIRFTNFNDVYKDYGIDPQTDFLDPGHFNAAGVPKYSYAVAGLLMEKYDLPDRRLDDNHIWNRSEKTEVLPVYALDQQFYGDGQQNYIDTGLKLYDNMLDSWTILADFVVPPFDDMDHVVFACYNETTNQYQGLLVNMDENNRLIVRYSSYEDMRSDRLEENTRVRLGIVKKGKNISVYLNGEFLGSHELQNLARYTGDLLIGCQQAEDGTFFRFSRPVVYDLQVYDVVMSETEIKAWTPRELPEPQGKDYLSPEKIDEQRLYALDYRFTGDGLESYVDTGIKLYQYPDDTWTILSRIDPEIKTGDSVYFSAFVEDSENYHGLLVRRPEVDKLNIVYGKNGQFTIDLPTDKVSTLAIEKDKYSYTVYLNGEVTAQAANSPCDAHDQTLLIGCQILPDGSLFRFSGTSVYNFEVIHGLLSQEYIAAWTPEALAERPKPEPSPVEFELSGGIPCDGKKVYLDTGIMLYDVPDKNWHIHLVLDISPSTSGTALSCFAEDPNDYRGLLIRQINSESFGITLGNTYHTVPINNAQHLVLDIVKESYSYILYANGEKIAEAESRTKSWDGPLFVGAERLLNGEPFRFSTQKIRQLTVSEVIPSEADIIAGSQENFDVNVFRK